MRKLTEAEKKMIIRIAGISITADGLLSLWLKPKNESTMTQIGRVARTLIGLSIILLTS